MASTDTPEDNKGFAEKNDATFPILSDPEMEYIDDYGVIVGGGYATRWTFYIDKEGIIRKIDKSVNVRSAGEDLVANLEALGFPKAAEES